MLNREYEALTKLDHPLITELLETFIDNDFVYFVTPFYKGGELLDQLYINNDLSD